MKITAEMVLSWGPCAEPTNYRDPKVLASLTGGESLSVCDVLRLPIPGADRLWVVLREGVLPALVLREFAAMCAAIRLEAERDAGREPDPRSWAAVDVALRHAAGEATDEELSAARSAARSAAGLAVGWAARSAAWSAAESAAWAAAWSAAESAARDVQCEILYALCIERGIE